MMFRMSELRYVPDPLIERTLDALLMLHADHEQNASTTAVRAVGSTHVNPYAAVAAGVAALSGHPLLIVQPACLQLVAGVARLFGSQTLAAMTAARRFSSRTTRDPYLSRAG